MSPLAAWGLYGNDVPGAGIVTGIGIVSGTPCVDDLEGLNDALKLARQEEASAFGDPTVLREKFIDESTYVELQILADKHGQVVHLVERDCSIQCN